MKQLKLLIVDDELGIREGSRRILKKFTLELPYLEEDYSFDIDTAQSGEEALEKVAEKYFDIILLDNKLPGIAGTEVLDHLHSRNIASTTIMITAFASVETAVAATKSGAYDFLAKPFTPEELKNAVHKAAKHIVLSKLTRELTEEKHKIRFQFLSVLSHELKSPLNAVDGYLQIMQNQTNGVDLCNYERVIERSLSRIDQMRKLIFDLLDLTRIESGEKKRSVINQSLSELLEGAVEEIQLEAQKKNIQLIIHSDNEVKGNFDATEMLVIMNNLLSNAVKYNKDHGSIEISLYRNDSNVVFSVKDSGIGISEADQKKLFREFSRIHNQKTKNIPGSGLGLSIVKKIVSLYDGSISVSSEPEKGTEFIVVFKNL